MRILRASLSSEALLTIAGRPWTWSNMRISRWKWLRQCVVVAVRGGSALHDHIMDDCFRSDNSNSKHSVQKQQRLQRPNHGISRAPMLQICAGHSERDQLQSSRRCLPTKVLHKYNGGRGWRTKAAEEHFKSLVKRPA
jgi:hypothetical protein